MTKRKVPLNTGLPAKGEVCPRREGRDANSWREAKKWETRINGLEKANSSSL